MHRFGDIVIIMATHAWAWQAAYFTHVLLFFFERHHRRSPNGTQPNFATSCSEKLLAFENGRTKIAGSSRKTWSQKLPIFR